MFELRTKQGLYIDRYYTSDGATTALKEYTNKGMEPTMTYVNIELPKYILTYTATEHHESYSVGHMQEGSEEYTLEAARNVLREERKHWGERFWTRTNQGEGFEIWTIGLRKVK